MIKFNLRDELSNAASPTQVKQIFDDLTDPSASEHVINAAKRANRILDSSYEKADIKLIVDKITTINNAEKKSVLKLLTKFETLFDGTLGDFNCEPADLQLKPGENTRYHTKRAFSVPYIHWEILKKGNRTPCKIRCSKTITEG